MEVRLNFMEYWRIFLETDKREGKKSLMTLEDKVLCFVFHRLFNYENQFESIETFFSYYD